MILCRHETACDVLLRLRQLLDTAVSLPPGAATGCCSRPSYRLPGSLHDGLVPHAVELWPAAAWPVHATNSNRCALLLLCGPYCCVRLCFGAPACSCLAGPCHQLNQVCSSSVVLGCALRLWPAVTWPVHATNSTRCALLFC